LRKKHLCYLLIILLISLIFSNNCFGQVEKVTAVAGGERHSIALMESGAVWSWGANGAGLKSLTLPMFTSPALTKSHPPIQS